MGRIIFQKYNTILTRLIRSVLIILPEVFESNTSSTNIPKAYWSIAEGGWGTLVSSAGEIPLSYLLARVSDKYPALTSLNLKIKNQIKYK
jgi:hypothetical protein